MLECNRSWYNARHCNGMSGKSLQNTLARTDSVSSSTHENKSDALPLHQAASQSRLFIGSFLIVSFTVDKNVTVSQCSTQLQTVSTFQITLLCLATVTTVYARPGYYGYPHAAGLAHAAPLPVHDTPEVAAAKSAHFAAYNAAAVTAAASPDHGAYGGHYGGSYGGHYDDGQYHDGRYGGHYDDGQYHGEHYDDGQYREGLYGGHYDDGQYREAPYGGHYAGAYTGHYAAAPAIVNGVPVDTPEVAAAKAAHFAAHAHAAGHHYG